MNWNDLCGINTVAGKAIDIPTLVGPGVDRPTWKDRNAQRRDADRHDERCRRPYV